MKTTVETFLLYLFALLLISPSVLAQSSTSTGSVRGTITDPTGAVIINAKVRLTTANGKYDATVQTDEVGRYRFNSVPLDEFSLHVEAPGFAPADFKGEVLGTPPIIHNVQFKGATAVQQITVTDSVLGVGTAASHFEFDDDALERRPLQSPNQDLPAVVLSVPGVVPEENGRMHIRGSEVQPQYVLDGVPISENVSSTFATAIDAENLRSTQVITGDMPAEYGDRLAAIVNLNTKSGLDMPWMGALSLSGGSFDSGGVDGEIGGHVKNVGIFATADGSRSSRFLDPPEIDNFRNEGGVAHLFSRIDWSLSTKDTLRLTLSTNGSNFEVPNTIEQQEEGQRIRQELRDDYEALSWSHIFGPNTSSEVALFRRSSSAKLLDPQFTGTPFYLSQNRRQRSEGLKATLTHDWKWNSFKFGVEGRRLPINESFQLAVTDPEDVDPEAPVSEFTPGDPFIFHDATAGNLESAFVQDNFRIGRHLNIDAGLRFDHSDLVVHDNAFSPRIGVAYHIEKTNTTIHGAYNRLYQTPPIENLLLTSSPATEELTEAEDEEDEEEEGGVQKFHAERQNHYQFGVRQQFGRHVSLNVTRYIKNVTDWLDDEQLFETAIVFPVQLARGDVRGTEVRLDLASLAGFSGYFSYANARATVTAPITGGLFIAQGEDEDEGEFTAAGEQFPADSDERNEAELGVTYTHRSGFWGSFNARYDSGIPSEFDSEEYESFDPRIQEQLDPVRHRLKPRTVFGFAAGADLFRESRFPITLQVGVNNFTDRFYMYNFHSIFSGTHIGRPREAIVRLTFHWKSK